MRSAATGRVFTTFGELALKVSRGDRLLPMTAKVELEVDAATADEILTRVVDGGELGEHKASTPRGPTAVRHTDKDRSDLLFGMALGVAMVALSFVQSASDVTRVRAMLEVKAGRRSRWWPSSRGRRRSSRLDEIVAAADVVMVARGDLGLEIPLERVHACRKRSCARPAPPPPTGVPVIVATQVLESMRTETRPTRAEASDAAGAVDGGPTRIMLAGETATGFYPVRSVEVLDAISAMPKPYRRHPIAVGRGRPRWSSQPCAKRRCRCRPDPAHTHRRDDERRQYGEEVSATGRRPTSCRDPTMPVARRLSTSTACGRSCAIWKETSKR